LAGLNCRTIKKHRTDMLAYNNSEPIMTAKMYVVVAPPLMVEEIVSIKKKCRIFHCLILAVIKTSFISMNRI
jgi:hypothetical protein